MRFHQRTPYFVQCQLTKLRKISKHRPGCANSEISCQDLSWPSFPLFAGARCENTSCSLKRKSCSSAQETLDEGYEDNEKTSNSSVLAAFFSPTYLNTSWITASLELKLIHSFAVQRLKILCDDVNQTRSKLVRSFKVNTLLQNVPVQEIAIKIVQLSSHKFNQKSCNLLFNYFNVNC